MIRVLYITNIEVPYKVIFFNKIARECELTVLYERSHSINRDSLWANSITKNYKAEYLDGIKLGNEYSFSFRILRYLNQKWDKIIISCYNSKVQMLAIIFLRMMNMPYYISLDGEAFISQGLKDKIKIFFLKGAKGYFVAGKESGKNLKMALQTKAPIYPYYFSSMNQEEISKNIEIGLREKYVLVVGQYFDYKGIDVAYRTACSDKDIKYKFVGMGNRTDIFLSEHGKMPNNIEVIPFLQKDDLEKEYRKCACLLLPTRQECWGLVVNEAASFGTPIVSTWGSGAAVEFLSEHYKQYLAVPGDYMSLLECIKMCLAEDNNEYSKYLMNKARNYSIDRMVAEHLKIFKS